MTKKSKKPRPLFTREDRVEWDELGPSTHVSWPETKRGTVVDVHWLGEHGYAYAIRQDGEALPVEVREVELREETKEITP